MKRTIGSDHSVLRINFDPTITAWAPQVGPLLRGHRRSFPHYADGGDATRDTGNGKSGLVAVPALLHSASNRAGGPCMRSDHAVRRAAPGAAFGTDAESPDEDATRRSGCDPYAGLSARSPAESHRMQQQVPVGMQENTWRPEELSA